MEDFTQTQLMPRLVFFGLVGASGPRELWVRTAVSKGCNAALIAGIDGLVTAFHTSARPAEGLETLRSTRWWPLWAEAV
jgi:hypothetical protein